MLKKHKGIFIILAILCSAVIFTVLSSKSVVEDNKIIKVPSTEVVRIAQNKISEQGYDGYYTEKIYPPILVTDRKTNQFLAEIFHGGEEYYTQFSFPYFTYKVTLKHPSLPNVEVSVDANDGKVTGWKFEENPVLDKYNNGTFAEENYLEAIGLLAVNGINSDNVLLEREEVDTETGKTKLVFKNHESVVESDFGSAFIFYEIEIKNGAVTEFSTKMSLPVAFSNYLDKNQQKSDDINGFWFWTNIFIFVIALIVLYKNRSSALHYRDKVLVFLGSVLFLVFLEAFNGLPSILHITNNGTLFGILFNYLISALSLVVALVLPGLVFYLAGSIIYEQVKKERFSMFKGSKNKNGDLLTCTIYGYIGAVIMGVLVLAASFFDHSSSLPGDSLGDLEYLVSSFVPSFSVFFMVALVPAILEEITFRLFTFVLLLQTTKSCLISVVLTTLLWVLPHVDLVGDIDILSVIYFTVTGLLLMFVFLRYGLYSAIIIHFTVNATLGMVLLSAFFGYDMVNVTIYLSVILTPVFLYVYKTYVKV